MTDEEQNLEEELDLCRKYLHIEGLRLDDRLKVEFQLEADPSILRFLHRTLSVLARKNLLAGTVI